MHAPSGYYRHPTIHGDAVVFVCEDDLWSVDRAGGIARRLTANPGRITFPSFSPDGRSLLFTGQDEGPNEAYVMPAEGGTPRRITWLGSTLQTVGWQPDGKRVVFASDWREGRRALVHLCTTDVDGVDPQRLPWGPARAIAYGPRGKGVVLGRNSGDPARWKRYRGGTAGTIWIDRKGDGAFRELLPLGGNLANPMWIGGRIYFLSDHEGHGNLYSCTPAGKDVVRHTDHEDFFVRFPSTDGKRIVYHAGADLHVYDPVTERSQRIDVQIASPRVERGRKFVSAAKDFETFALHPRGHSAAVVARGGAFTLGLWDGPVVRHGKPSAERRRLATWLPDGKRIVSVSDAGGEEVLRLEAADGRGAGATVAKGFGRAVEIRVAPGSASRLALANHKHELFLVDLTKKTKKRVAQGRYVQGFGGLAWSPDGRYLVYAMPTSMRTFKLVALDTATGRSHDLTSGEYADTMPSFDPDGRYLYFVSWRVFDPVYDAHYFQLGFPKGSRPYLATLQKSTPSPFDAAQRAPRTPLGTQAEEEAKRAEHMKAKGKGAMPQVKIDFDGLADRIVPLPVPEGSYDRVAGANGRILFTSQAIEGSLDQPWPMPSEPPAKTTLHAYDFDDEKTVTLHEGITDFSLSMNSQVLALRIGNRMRVVPSASPPEKVQGKPGTGRASGWIDLERIRPEVVPGEEWRQMVGEAWRLQRDQFWTADMAGVDWPAVYDRYVPLVDRVACRSEVADLIWEMQGELGTSHAYEFGGDYRFGPSYGPGFLGADLEFRRTKGTWHIRRIPRGDTWAKGYGSPLAAPGLVVKPGDQILAVDGTSVGRKRSPYECLVGKAGQTVRLTLKTGGGKPRTLFVQASPSEVSLRYRDWVEANRATVHKASRGKVGYVHIPDMGPNGYAEFHRTYRQEVEYEGLIVDVRHNGGGHVSQLLLEKLARKRIGYDVIRDQDAITTYPEDAPMGPMVALTNEYAGSDGDIFSHSFKLMGLGPLIGKRTWGGVVGIWPRFALVDGTITTQPQFSTYFVDVGWAVENYGTDPDIEVDIRPQDHAAGKDPQLERGLQEVLKIVRKQKPRVPKFSPVPSMKPPRLSKR